MNMRFRSPGTLTLAVGLALMTTLVVTSARQQGGDAVAIDADDIGGVVTSAKGPEAGVWVIAETTDLPTQFAKIVVTDDRGRYLVPDLPKANYNVWVRGYGLVDSPKVQAAPGRTAEPDRGRRAESHARPRSTTRPATGRRCSRVPGQERVPRHRRAGQRHLAGDEDAGPVAAPG